MKYSFAGLLLLFFVTACGFNHENASGHYTADKEQCVVYARKLTGVQLYGDADTWWDQAAGRYQRGNKPSPNAILVLQKTTHMRSGHVAVVKDIVNDREIHVTQSNWGNSWKTRHVVYDSQLARDVSAANDWTMVRFWNDDKNVLGFSYPAYGFIYP
jgi:surface antigen